MEFQDMKVLARLIADEMEKRHSADMAAKWEGGTVVFKPAHPTHAQHELSMERFMNKVVMVRDNLRVLEQQINGNANLSSGEKIKLQSYITKVYGSLTSFNFMFYYEEDKFKGQG